MQLQIRENNVLKSAEKIVLIGTVLGISIMWGMAIYFWLIFPAQETQYMANSSVVSFTEELCSRIQGNRISQGECYLKVAKTKRNENVCGNILVTEIRSLCYAELAEIKGNGELCKKAAETPTLMTVCQDYLSSRSGSQVEG
jgi:hypothetical protein